jgi:membrane complex biogenesis BtpA family protein
MLEDVFSTTKPVIGMIHLQATAGFKGFQSMSEVIKSALEDAQLLENEGVNGLLVENSFNLPFDKVIRPETIAAMAICVHEVAKQVSIPVGVVVIMEPNDISAMAIAKSAGAKFIRAESFNEAVILPFGIYEGRPAELIQYQKSIDAEDIKIFGDIHIKSGTMLAPRTLKQSAQGAIMSGADGVIITGERTGVPPTEEQLQEVKNSVNIPILIGSGATAENLSMVFQYVDGCIVGTEFKQRGVASPIDPQKVKIFMKAAEAARK